MKKITTLLFLASLLGSQLCVACPGCGENPPADAAVEKIESVFQEISTKKDTVLEKTTEAAPELKTAVATADVKPITIKLEPIKTTDLIKYELIDTDKVESVVIQEKDIIKEEKTTVVENAASVADVAENDKLVFSVTPEIFDGSDDDDDDEEIDMEEFAKLAQQIKECDFDEENILSFETQLPVDEDVDDTTVV